MLCWEAIRANPALKIVYWLEIARTQGPDGFPRAVEIEKNEPNVYKIKYTPDDCGRYTIDALYDGKPLPQTPIHVQSFSTGNVSVHSSQILHVLLQHDLSYFGFLFILLFRPYRIWFQTGLGDDNAA